MIKKLFSFLSVFKKIPKKVWIPVLIILVAVGFFAYKKQTAQKTPQLAAVKREDLKQEISASGTLTGKDSTTLKFKSPGKLAFINTKQGDSVYSGEVIAGLDTQDLSISLQQAENNLRNQEANLAEVYDQVQGHSKDETFALRATRTAAEVAKDNAYDNVKAAQRAFQDAVITSPINGIVTEEDPLPGQNVSVTDTIVQVVDFSQIIFAGDVDESDINNVSLGQKAEVTLNTYGDRIFTGTVTDISPTTHTTSNGQTAVTVKIILDNQAVKPITGLNGQVNIDQTQKTNTLAIPQDALRQNNTVIVDENNKLKAVKVTPGFKSDTDVEILDGLQEGQQVVTDPGDFKV